MLSTAELKTLARNFGQYQKDHEYAQAAQAQAELGWQGIIRSLREYDPEDADRERIINECRSQGIATPGLIKNVHRAFDYLGIVGSKATIPSGRTKIIKAAVDQALTKKGGKKATTRPLDTAVEIEQQLAKGRESRAIGILRTKLWKVFIQAGELIEVNEDLMSIEETATFFTEEFVPAWHKAYDEGIAARKAAEQKAAVNAKK